MSKPKGKLDEFKLLAKSVPSMHIGQTPDPEQREKLDLAITKLGEATYGRSLYDPRIVETLAFGFGVQAKGLEGPEDLALRLESKSPGAATAIRFALRS